MKAILTLLLLLLALQIQAQSGDPNVISNSGGLNTNASYQISFTIGETFTGTISNDTSIDQGFWTGVPASSLLSVNDFKLENSTLTFYPNPVTNFFTIQLEDVNEYEVSLYTINGQQVLQKTIIAAPQGNQIDIQPLSKGIYILTISISETNQNKTFKIIKN